jgi:hypothetical protein
MRVRSWAFEDTARGRALHEETAIIGGGDKREGGRVVGKGRSPGVGLKRPFGFDAFYLLAGTREIQKVKIGTRSGGSTLTCCGLEALNLSLYKINEI